MKRAFLWSLFAALLVISFSLPTQDALYWTMLGVAVRKRRG